MLGERIVPTDYSNGSVPIIQTGVPDESDSRNPVNQPEASEAQIPPLVNLIETEPEVNSRPPSSNEIISGVNIVGTVNSGADLSPMDHLNGTSVGMLIDI